jgi:hypothetical protein
MYETPHRDANGNYLHGLTRQTAGAMTVRGVRRRPAGLVVRLARRHSVLANIVPAVPRFVAVPSVVKSELRHP